MDFNEAYQQYIEESDPDYHTSMEALFQWFFYKGQEALTADILRLEEALQQCVDWAAAYPVDIFPQPTPEQVDAVCKTLGFRIDSISAMVLRNYTGRIGEIAREALAR